MVDAGNVLSLCVFSHPAILVCVTEGASLQPPVARAPGNQESAVLWLYFWFVTCGDAWWGETLLWDGAHTYYRYCRVHVAGITFNVSYAPINDQCIIQLSV